MNKRFVHIFTILALILLLAGCKAEPAAPTTVPTAATTAPKEATTVPTEATIPTEETTVPTETLPTAATEPPVEEAAEPEISEDADSSLPYTQRIERADQAIYSGPGSEYKLVGTVQEKGVYTIVEESVDDQGNLWGKLKSGLGWINLTEIQSQDYGTLPYRQRIVRHDQAVYAGPGYDYQSRGTVQNQGVYTIVEEAKDEFGNLWGKLKSGIGWVDLTEIQSDDYESALMSANYANEELMSREEHHYYSCGREYCIPIIFRAYGNLRNVTLFDLQFTDEGFSAGKDFFTLPEMTKDMPLVAELDFPGDMSMYGIRFIDEDGITHTYRISENLAYYKLIFEEA